MHQNIPVALTEYPAKEKYAHIDYRNSKDSLLLIDLYFPYLKKDFPFLLAPNICYLTPAPLHWMRQRWRGFNQSQVLTESLAKELGLEFADVLTRKKFTKTQKNLKKEQRIKNMESAFILKSPLPPITPLSPLMPINSTAFPAADDTQPRLSPIHNQNFILIDDVTTTGSTLREAAKVLKRNGAQKVFCLTVARD